MTQICVLVIGWVEVAWKNGTSNSYRMGADGKFDLRVVENRPTSESSGEPSSSAPVDEGHSEEEPSTEETETRSSVEPQQESSSTSQDVDVSSMVLVEEVRVEDIPDEGIFTSDDIIESPGTEIGVIVLESSGDVAEVVPVADEAKETVSETAEVTAEQGITSEPVTEAAGTNNASGNNSVGETARR